MQTSLRTRKIRLCLHHNCKPQLTDVLGMKIPLNWNIQADSVNGRIQSLLAIFHQYTSPLTL
jgi:hypothetical protein